MAEVNIAYDSGSPSRVAYDLTNRIMAIEAGNGIHPKGRADVLALYAQCLDAARGRSYNLDNVS